MARQARHDADYYPMICKNGTTFTLLRQRFGVSGIGMFTELCMILTTTPYHHIGAQNGPKHAVLAARIGVEESVLDEFLSLLVLTGKIDNQLWEKAQVVVSQDLLDSLDDAYRNRVNDIITVSELKSQYLGADPEEIKTAEPKQKPKKRTAKPTPPTDDDTLSDLPDDDFDAPAPWDTQPGTGGSNIDKLIAHWNSKTGVWKKCRYSSVNIPNSGAIIEKMKVYSIDEICQGIDVLADSWNDIEKEYRPKTLDRFITNSIDLWVGEEKPETAEEKRQRILELVNQRLAQ